MLVFHAARLVILATPKTGSTALEAVLAADASVAVVRPPELKHVSARRYRRMLAPFVENGRRFDVVALMREPEAWLASWYRFRSRPSLAGTPRGTAGISFDAFVRDHLGDPVPEHADVGWQGRFLGLGTPAAAARVFRYEAPAVFLDFLGARLGLDISLPVLNVSPAVPTDLAPGTRSLLRAARAADFAFYEGLGGSA